MALWLMRVSVLEARSGGKVYAEPAPGLNGRIQFRRCYAHRRGSAVGVFAALPVLLLGLAAAPKHASLIVLIVLALGITVLASQAVMHAMSPACYPTAIRGAGVGAGILLARGRTTSQLFLYLVPLALLGGICALWLLWRLTSTDYVHLGRPPQFGE